MIYFTTLINSGLTGKTLLEQVQDGEDTISVYESHELRSQSEEIKYEETFTADVLVRKTLKNDTYIVFLENVRYKSKLDEKDPSNFTTYLELPLIVKLNNDSELQNIIVSNNDITKSLTLKHEVIEFLLGDTSKVTPAWGKCKLPYKVTFGDEFNEEIRNATRADCKGSEELDAKPFKNALPDSHITIKSSWKPGIYDDVGVEVLLTLKEADADNSPIEYSIEKKIRFKEFKASVKEIDESEFTVSMQNYLYMYIKQSVCVFR